MTAGPLRMRRLRRLLLVLALPLVLALAFAPGALATGPPGSYTTSVFSDGFESGSLIGWDGLLGNGSATVIPGAAHTGTFGLEMSNGPQQFQVAVKSFPSTYADSSTSFWVRLAAGSGFQMVAQARDSTSSAHMWDLAYDGGQTHLLLLSVQRDRQHGDRDGRRDGAGNTWIHVEIQYTATATGGARIYLNDQTQAGWARRGRLHALREPAAHPALERRPEHHRLRRCLRRDACGCGDRPGRSNGRRRNPG